MSEVPLYAFYPEAGLERGARVVPRALDDGCVIQRPHHLRHHFKDSQSSRSRAGHADGIRVGGKGKRVTLEGSRKGRDSLC